MEIATIIGSHLLNSGRARPPLCACAHACDGGRAGGGRRRTAVSECVMKSSNIKFNGLSLGGMGWVCNSPACVR